MLEARVISPYSSPWGFPVVFVNKKDGAPRFCIDYRSLNDIMKADKFSIPLLEEIVDDTGDAELFSGLYMFSGCWQIALRKRQKRKRLSDASSVHSSSKK